MSFDLDELFTAAGRTSPESTIDVDAVVHRGRQVRARRRTLVGTATLLSVSALTAGALALTSGGLPGDGRGAPLQVGVVAPPRALATTAATKASVPRTAAKLPVGPAPSGAPAGAKGESPPADVAAVALADPAPGFPLRRWSDGAELTSMAGGRDFWVATFGVALRPEITSTDSAGSVSGEPTGPEATVMVGAFPLPAMAADGTIEGHPVVATVPVAGVTGHVTRFTEKTSDLAQLFFSSGRFSVEITGFGGVTPDQLVALGNALTGLQ